MNGQIIGIFGGSLSTIKEGSGTAYRAPHSSLPLLFVMKEQDTEARAKYYTKDTPLNDVHQTLISGNFTGYIELRENILSGDYYVVYHSGNSMSVAFVGTNDDLITGEQAFERA
ncbi:MAG: hypothetical protein ABEI86_07250, partial [Halobacteriaceae archaeon]